MNLIFYHFNCSEHLLKSHHVFLVPVVAACSQLLLKSVSKPFENVEWSNSLLKHFKIQTLLKINFSMAAISAFGVTQHSQIFSLCFRNRIQCIALYQLHSSQALLNLRRGYYSTIDYAISSYDLFQKISHFIVKPESYLSDHCQIVTWLEIDKQNKDKSQWKNDLFKLPKSFKFDKTYKNVFFWKNWHHPKYKQKLHLFFSNHIP